MLLKRSSLLEQVVYEGGFTVVDVGNNTNISYFHDQLFTRGLANPQFFVNLLQMKTFLKSLVFGLMAFSLHVAPAFADDVYQVIVKKQEVKKKTRWSLSEWMATKEKMRWMDLWLAMNSPSPYEFYLGVDTSFGRTLGGKPPTDASYVGYRGSLAAYAHLFGLEVQADTESSRFHAAVLARILGFQVQGTNITLQAGLRSQAIPLSVRNVFLGVGTSLYLIKSFGVDALYRGYLLSSNRDGGGRTRGFRVEAGPFIDFKFVRVYGQYFYELERVLGNELQSDQRRSGGLVGLRFFF